MICLGSEEFNMFRPRQIYTHNYTNVLVFGHGCKWLVADRVYEEGEAEGVKCTATYLELLRRKFQVQVLFIIGKQEGFIKGNRTGKVVNVTKNKRGPKMLPWGIPDLTGSKSEE